MCLLSCWEVGESLVEALVQFMKLYPHMVPGSPPASQTPFYAFGQSYGGAYVVSLAHVYLQVYHNQMTEILGSNNFGSNNMVLRQST